jgi:SOS response regulatory protein OraA/RecX
MAEFYTNLPPKEKDDLDKTVEKLTTSNYQADYQFNVGEYDSTIAFFVKRGFSRTAAESTAYAILSQAKIDNIKPQEILDKLTYASPALLSELITIILNANRYKSSRLGVRQTLTTKGTVSRNIID